MKPYRCSPPSLYDTCQAVQIAMIATREGGATLYPILTEHEAPYSIEVTDSFMNKHRPSAGGFYLVYPDSHTAYMTAQAFMARYQLIQDTGE